jgi:hypothetical protein
MRSQQDLIDYFTRGMEETTIAVGPVCWTPKSKWHFNVCSIGRAKGGFTMEEILDEDQELLGTLRDIVMRMLCQPSPPPPEPSEFIAERLIVHSFDCEFKMVEWCEAREVAERRRSLEASADDASGT